MGAALVGATLVTRELRLELLVEVGHADGARVEHALRGQTGWDVVRVDYHATGIRIHVAVEPEGLPGLSGTVASMTSGAGRVTPGTSTWVDRPHSSGR